MYNVILDKATLQSGREIAGTTLTKRTSDNDVPVGGLALMQLYLSQAEASMQSYTATADGYHPGIFGLANSAITSLTVAAEFVSQLQGPFRIGYLDVYEGIRKQDHVRFHDEVERMLFLMNQMINILKKRESARMAPPSKKVQDNNNRLMYALHLANMAVSVTQPEGNIYQHPTSTKWLTIRSRVLRNLSASLIALAKLDEAAAQQ